MTAWAKLALVRSADVSDRNRCTKVSSYDVGTAKHVECSAH